FSPDGKRLASASYDGTVKVWDAQADPKPLTHQGARSVVSVAFSPDGKRLASSTSRSGEVKVWNLQTRQELFTLKQAERGGVQCVAFSPDGKRMASSTGGDRAAMPGGPPGEVKVWDAQTGQELL